MSSSGIDEIRQAKLFYSPQPLKNRVFDQLHDQPIRYTDKAINRIIKYF